MCSLYVYDKLMLSPLNYLYYKQADIFFQTCTGVTSKEYTQQFGHEEEEEKEDIDRRN